jgi:WD40 repeat protein
MREILIKILGLLIVFILSSCVSTDESVVQEDTHLITAKTGWFLEIYSWKDSRDNPIVSATPIYRMAVSADGRTIAASCYDRDSNTWEIKVWDMSSGEIILSYALPEGSIMSFGLTPDGKYLVSGIGEQKIAVINLKSGRVTKTIPVPLLAIFKLSGDGQFILAGCTDGILKIYNFKTKKLMHEMDVFDNYPGILEICCSNTVFAAYDDNRGIVIGDLVTGELITRISTDKLHALTLSPDGKYLAGGQENDPFEILLWDTETGNQVGAFKRGSWNNEYVNTLSISSDNSYLIAGSFFYNELEVWELSTGKLINNLDAHESGITSMTMTADGKSFITAGLDRSIKLWRFSDVSCHIAQLDFPDDFAHVEKYRSMGRDPRVENIPAEIMALLPESYVLFLEKLVQYLLKDEDDPFMQVKLIHDWLIYYLDYNYGQKLYLMSEVLTIKKGACSDYAELFDKMCVLAGIETVMLGGSAWDGFSWGHHAWNRVKINGLWYLVDVTFDDGTDSNMYFLANPEVFAYDHFPNGFENQMLDRIITWEELY